MVKNLLLLFVSALLFQACGNEPNSKSYKNFDVRVDSSTVTTTANIHDNSPDGNATIGSEEDEASDKSIRATIEGVINNGAHTQVILDQMGLRAAELKPLRSTTINEENRFRFEGMLPQKGLYQLRFPTGVIHLFITGGTVTINADLYNLSDYTVQGSIETRQLREFYLVLNESNKRNHAVQERMNDRDDRARFLQFYDSLPIINANLEKQRTDDIKAFIRRVDNSLIAALATNHIDAGKNIEFLIEVRDKMRKIDPNSVYVQNLENRINPLLNTAVGSTPPEITLQDIKGNTLPLSSFKGKYVLIDFWASWCQPCRIENPKMLEVYNKYKDKGFEIYGVSLDQSIDNWKKAVAEDKITWPQVIDTRAWESPIAKEYALTAIPTTLLLDKDGKIIAKNLRSHELEARLSQILR